MRCQLANQKKINVWSEQGFVFCMEDGDIEPYEMDIHTTEQGANELLNAEFDSYKLAGYEVVIGKPKVVKEDFILEGEIVNVN